MRTKKSDVVGIALREHLLRSEPKSASVGGSSLEAVGWAGKRLIEHPGASGVNMSRFMIILENDQPSKPAFDS